MNNENEVDEGENTGEKKGSLLLYKFNITLILVFAVLVFLFWLFPLMQLTKD